MSQAYDAARIATLAGDIVRWRRLYEAGTPEVTDAVFDRAENELRGLAPDHPALAAVGAASQSMAKVRHETPMLSLQKTYAREDLASWRGDRPAVGTLKVDGVSMSLVYEDGRLVCGKTRGNGLVGEDVTAKIAWVADVLPRLEWAKKRAPKAARIEVRGELFCTESQFVKLSDRFAALGLERPTSARNIVAGLLGRKTHVELSSYFNFFAFNVVDPIATLGVRTESEQLEWLESLGFRLPAPRLVTTEEEVDAYLESVRARIEDDEIGLDGAVFVYDELAVHGELGNTSHHPRFKMAFKWQGQTAVSTVRDIVWATSRLGIVTPVAVIDPVFLSGAQITNVTLHNAAHVRAVNLKAGDKIEIVRSGEVIPKFLQVTEAAEGSYLWPKKCPSCKTALDFDEVRLKCPALATCPAQRLGVVLNWIRAAGIDDLSEKRLVPLIDAGLVETAADLYRLRDSDFLVIPQTKEKMATKLAGNVERSRRLPLAAFLNGLGIEGAGHATWEALLERFPTLDAVLAASEEDVATTHGFAEKSAEQIVQGLAARRPLIDALLAAGVAPTPPEASGEGAGGLLAGKALVITGSLSKPRSEIEKAIKAAGGKVASAVSAHTHAVVTDDPSSDSSKMKKARQLGLPVWSEADLERALSG